MVAFVAALWIASAWSTSAVFAQESGEVIEYRIETQPLDGALIEFAKQSEAVFVAPGATLQGKVGNPVTGAMSPDEALGRLLRGTGLQGEVVYGEVRVLRVFPSNNEGRNSVTMGRRRTLLSGIATAFLAGAGASAQAPTNQDVESIVVTGSRIQRSGMTTPTPVTVMGATELSAMSPGNLVDALDQVPQFLNNANPGSAASKADSAGAANANLRGIGSKRTLVLLDGRRVVPSNRLGNVDINLFPEDLVQRVETVTGGASAAYGTDAVAGVVNFILDTEFEGLRAHAQAGETSRGDNGNYEIGMTGGMALMDGRLHVVASGDYYESERIDNLAGRDWYQGYGLVTNPDWTATNGVTPRLLVLPNVTSLGYTNGGFIDAPGTSINRLLFRPDGTTAPFVYGSPAAFRPGTQIPTGTQSMAGGSGYNPTNFDTSVSSPNFPQGTRSGSFIPDVARSSAFLGLDFDVTSNFKVYGQAMWGRNQANSVGTLPLGHSTWALTVYEGNPYLPANVATAMANENISSFKLQRYHTSADIAQDRMLLDNTTLALTAGFELSIEGGFFNGWQISGYGQSGKNDNHLDFVDFMRRDRVALALDAVVDPSTGSIVCNVTLVNPGQYQDCVPLNLLGVGNASAEAVEWVNGDMTVDANTEQDVFELSANGEVHRGIGAGPISMAVGASYREQSIEHLLGPEDIMALDTPQNNPAAGIRGIPTSDVGQDDVLSFVDLEEYQGSFSVTEMFAESLLPLVSDAPLIQQFNLSLAGRWADYEGSGVAWAWKAGVDWQVVDEVRLRGTISRDVRAGSLEERFDRQGQGASVTDPEFDDLVYTTFQVRGGNPEVDPEKGDTITFGVVYEPSFLDGLSMSLDWYQVDVGGAIDLLGVQQIVDECFDVGGDICNRVIRDPSTNMISRVDNVFSNLGSLKTSGVDFEVAYGTDVDWLPGGAERLSGRLLSSWLEENSVTSAAGVVTDRVGVVGGAAAFPDLRITGNITYSNGPFSLFVQERYISEGINNITYVEGVDIADNSVDAVFYTDLRAAYTLESASGSEAELFVNVTNVLDQDPPLIPTWSNFSGTGSGTNDTFYDPLGRRFVGGVRLRF